jgi:hypothetical protein
LWKQETNMLPPFWSKSINTSPLRSAQFVTVVPQNMGKIKERKMCILCLSVRNAIQFGIETIWLHWIFVRSSCTWPTIATNDQRPLKDLQRRRPTQIKTYIFHNRLITSYYW